MRQLISSGGVRACPRMNRALGALTLLYLFVVWNIPTLASTDVRSTVVYAPQPDYPIGARRRGWGGTAFFRCNVRPDGFVSSVIVLQSTGMRSSIKQGLPPSRDGASNPEQLRL